MALAAPLATIWRGIFVFLLSCDNLKSLLYNLTVPSKIPEGGRFNSSTGFSQPNLRDVFCMEPILLQRCTNNDYPFAKGEKYDIPI